MGDESITGVECKSGVFSGGIECVDEQIRLRKGRRFSCTATSDPQGGTTGPRVQSDGGV